MEQVICHIVPLLGASDNVICRQGAIEAIACILDLMLLCVSACVSGCMFCTVGQTAGPVETNLCTQIHLDLEIALGKSKSRLERHRHESGRR